MERCWLYPKCEVKFNVAQQNFAGKIQSVQLESGSVGNRKSIPISESDT